MDPTIVYLNRDNCDQPLILTKKTELQVLFDATISADFTREGVRIKYKALLQKLKNALLSLRNVPLGHQRLKRFWVICKGNHYADASDNARIREIIGILSCLHTNPELYLDVGWIYGNQASLLDMGTISKLYAVTEYAHKRDLNRFRSMGGKFLTHVGFLLAPSPYYGRKDVGGRKRRQAYEQRLAKMDFSPDMFDQLEPKDNAIIASDIISKISTAPNEIPMIESTQLEPEVAFRLRQVRNLSRNYDFVVKIMWDAHKNGAYHCDSKLNPNVLSVISKDVLQLIISYLNPTDWRVEGKKRKGRLTFKNQVHVKTFVNSYRRVRKESLDIDVKRKRIDKLGEELKRLEKIRDHEIPALKVAMKEEEELLAAKKKTFLKEVETFKNGKRKKKRRKNSKK